MSKPALGRGLGQLLNGTKTDSVPVEGQNADGQKGLDPLSPGLGTLIKGGADKAKSSDPARWLSLGRFGLLQWSLVAADVLLSVQTSLLFISSATPLSLRSILLCLGGLGLASWLGCLALLSANKPAPSNSRHDP